MNGLYKSSVSYTSNSQLSRSNPKLKPIQLFKGTIEETRLRQYLPIGGKTKIINLSDSGIGFLLERITIDNSNDKITFTHNSQVILESKIKGFYDKVILQFRYCNCSEKRGELYTIELEYLGETQEKPNYTKQPIRI